MREHLLAEKGQLLEEVGGLNFGPSMWHEDSSEKNYIKRWNKALATLSRISENPKAKALYEQARGNLLASLLYAIKDMEGGKSGFPLLNNKIRGFLDATKKKLQQ